MILICLSNSFFKFFIKMKNKKRTVFRISFSYESEKQMKGTKNSKKKSIKHENGSQLFEFRLSYWSKSKSKYRIFEFRFSIYQKHEMALWVHGYFWVLWVHFGNSVYPKSLFFFFFFDKLKYESWKIVLIFVSIMKLRQKTANKRFSDF